MKLTIEYDLKSESVVLTTDLSHRAFSVKRQFHCRECGTVNKNALVEALRAYTMYGLAAKGAKDVSAAVLAYDLDEILKALGEAPARHVHRSGMKRMAVGDGSVLVRKIRRLDSHGRATLTLADLGDLDDDTA